MMPNLRTLIFSGSLRLRAQEYRAAEMKFWASVACADGPVRRFEYSLPPRDVPASPMTSTEVQLYWVRHLTSFDRANAYDMNTRYLQLRSILDLTSLCVKHAAFFRHPRSVAQFFRVLHSSSSLEVQFPSWSPSSSSELTSLHASVSRLRCMTHPSTCTLSCTMSASHTYKRSCSTSSRRKRRPTRLRSLLS